MKFVLAVMVLAITGCFQSESQKAHGVSLRAEDGCVLKVGDIRLVMGEFRNGFWHPGSRAGDELEKALSSYDLRSSPVGLTVSPSMTFNEFTTVLSGISYAGGLEVSVSGDGFEGVCVTHLPLFASHENFAVRRIGQTCVISLLDEILFSAQAQQGKCEEKCTNVYERAVGDIPQCDQQNELPYIELACRPSTRMDRVLDYFSAAAKRGYKKVFLREWLTSPFWTSEY